MVKIVLGVIAGFVVWSIFWIGSQSLLVQLSPWYAEHYARVLDVMTKGGVVAGDPWISLVDLVRSFLTSVGAGYIAALVAGEYRRSTLALGFILILVGIAVEYFQWNLAPAWYHVLFILFLLPMTILGGRLRRPS